MGTKACHQTGIALGVAMLMLVLPALAAAQPMFSVTPKLAASWRSDDNFFKAETNEREVYTYLVQPGVALGYEAGKTKLNLDYSLNIYDYDDRDDSLPGSTRADDEDYIGHTVNFKARTQPFVRLGAGLDAGYQRTRDPAASDPLSNSTDRDKYDLYEVTPGLMYEFGAKFAASIRYRNTTIDYDKGSREDTSINRGILDVIYNFNPNTALDLEYQYWAADYSQGSSDYDSHQAKLILRHKFNILAIEAGAGLHNRDFERTTLEDVDKGIYSVAVLGDTGKTRFSIKSEWNLNDAGAGDNYYMAHRISARVGHTFLEKVPVSVGGYWQNSDYEHIYGLTPSGALELRDEDTFDINGSIGYKITEWATFTIKGGYEERDSNHAGRDYENGYAMGLVELAYNIGQKK